MALMAVARNVRIKIYFTENFYSVLFMSITRGVYVPTANNNNFKDKIIEVEHVIITIVALVMFVSVVQAKERDGRQLYF